MTRSLIGVVALLSACSSGNATVLGDAGAADTGAGANKITFADTCTAPTPCGGTLSGAYVLVDGCMNRGTDCKNVGAYGTTSGTFEVKTNPTTGDEYIAWEEEHDYANCPVTGSASQNLGGKHTISGNTISIPGVGIGNVAVYDYCVDGDDLWLSNPKVSFPRNSVHHFKRKP